MEPLSPELENLLAKERDIESQPVDVRGRVMARARAALRAAPASTSSSLWRRGGALLAAAALSVALAAMAVAAFREQRPAPGEQSSAVSHDGNAPPRTAPPSIATEEPSSEAPKRELSPPPSERAAAPASRMTPSNPEALELGLLQRARAFVARGEFAAALAAIGEHERRFPTGRLREEREALRVKALAGLGKKEEARAAAERFKSRYPRSVLSASIEEATRPSP